MRLTITQRFHPLNTHADMHYDDDVDCVVLMFDTVTGERYISSGPVDKFVAGIRRCAIDSRTVTSAEFQKVFMENV